MPAGASRPPWSIALRYCPAPVRNLLSRCVASSVVLLLAYAPARGALPHPKLSWIFPPGGQRGTQAEHTVGGADLDDAQALIFSHEGIDAEPVIVPDSQLIGKPRVAADRFTVKIDPDVPDGVYEARVVGAFGTSNPRAFMVGSVPESRDPGGNHTLQSATDLAVDTVVNGRADARHYDVYRVDLHAGQRVVLDCWAQRIDSRLDATIVVCNAGDRILASSRDYHHRDPLVDFTAPADAAYFVKVYDFVFAGSADHFYRLAVQTTPYVEFVYPPVATPGMEGSFAIFGRNLPEATPTAPAATLEQIRISAAVPAPDLAEPQAPSPVLADPIHRLKPRIELPGVPYVTRAGPVAVDLTRRPVVTESEPNDSPDSAQLVTPPCELAGRFTPRGDDDWAQFKAAKGDRFTIEVISQRTGLATDPYLLVQRVDQDDAGNVSVHDVGDADDTPRAAGEKGFDSLSYDPVLAFQADRDATYRVLVRDQAPSLSGNQRRAYRMILRRPQPDFQLLAAIKAPPEAKDQPPARWNPVVRRGGTAPIRVVAVRRDGFDAAVTLTVEGLPEGVTAHPAVIARGQTAATLVVEADDDVSAWTGPIRIVGREDNGDEPRVRHATAATVVWESFPALPSRATRDLVLAVAAEAAPVRIEPGVNKPLKIHAGEKVTAQMHATRRAAVKGDIVLQPISPPKGIQAGEVKFSGDAKQASLEISVDAGVPPGRYTLCLGGTATVAYERNREGLQRTKKLAQEVAELATKLAEAKQQATRAQQQATETLTAATAQAGRARKSLEALEQQIQRKSNARQQLIDSLADAKRAADQIAESPEVAASIAEIQQRVATLATRETAEMTQAREEAQEAVAAAAGRVEQAEEAKRAADARAKQATAAAAAAQREQKALQALVQEREKAAQAKDTPMYVAPPPITVLVRAAEQSQQ